MKQTSNRIIRIILFLLIIILTDRVFGHILRKLYFNQSAGQNYALTYSLSQCKADILVIGNSRAQHHYDSNIISQALKMSCYNAGQDGGHSIILSYALIKVITERYSPKIIILEFSPTGITHYTGDYDRLSILLPYYHDYPEIHSLIQLRGPFEKIKLISAIYPFNSNIINIIGFNTKAATLRQAFDGFVPLKEVMNENMLKSDPPVINQTPVDIKSAVDPNMISSLENIIQICKDRNITLFIINSPVFHRVNEILNPDPEITKITLDIIHRNNVNYLDFSNDPAFAGHIELFADKAHLNETGAKMFSHMLVTRLSKF